MKNIWPRNPSTQKVEEDNRRGLQDDCHNFEAIWVLEWTLWALCHHNDDKDEEEEGERRKGKGMRHEEKEGRKSYGNKD